VRAKDRPDSESNDHRDRRAALARRCLQMALLLGLIGLVPTLLATWGERRAAAAAAWRDPADDVQPAAIASDLALLSLAGIPDDRVLALAIEAGELETVRTLLTFSADLTDQQRMNGWLWLAYRYQQAGQTGRAAQAYRLAGGGAVLSGQLPELLRVETLLTVGRQLIPLHDDLSARFYLQQAALLGALAPHLTDYHRHTLLRRLIPAILRAGGRRADWVVLAEAVESGTAQQESVAFAWQEVTPGKDAALVRAQDARRAAAAAWLAALTANPVESPAVSQGQALHSPLERPAVSQGEALHSSAERPGDPDPGDAARLALHQALLAEDAAVDAYLAAGAAGSGGVAVQETRLHWLLLKRRIAAGGVGAGLVPEWESSRADIDAALTTAWADWLALYADPTGGAAGQAADATRQAIMAAYWGLYPDAPVADLVSKAQDLGRPGRLHLTIIKPGRPPVVGWIEGLN
jgi:hypothetical protein